MNKFIEIQIETTGKPRFVILPLSQISAVYHSDEHKSRVDTLDGSTYRSVETYDITRRRIMELMMS